MGQDGRYAVNGQLLDAAGVDGLMAALRGAAPAGAEHVVVISADGSATHQAVVNVMDAARRAGLARLTFATQSSGGGER